MDDDINDLFASLGITRDAGRAVNPLATSQPLSLTSGIASQIRQENTALRGAVTQVKELNRIRAQEIAAQRKQLREEQEREREQFQEVQRITESVQNRVDSRLFNDTSGIDVNDRERLTNPSDPAYGLYTGLQLSAAQEELQAANEIARSKGLTEDGPSTTDINRQVAAQFAVQLAEQEVNRAAERGFNVAPHTRTSH